MFLQARILRGHYSTRPCAVSSCFHESKRQFHVRNQLARDRGRGSGGEMAYEPSKLERRVHGRLHAVSPKIAPTVTQSCPYCGCLLMTPINLQGQSTMWKPFLPLSAFQFFSLKWWESLFHPRPLKSSVFQGCTFSLSSRLSCHIPLASLRFRLSLIVPELTLLNSCTRT